VVQHYLTLNHKNEAPAHPIVITACFPVLGTFFARITNQLHGPAQEIAKSGKQQTRTN
jgi:hypothetical protein